LTGSAAWAENPTNAAPTPNSTARFHIALTINPPPWLQVWLA
jgi:hypothetical protein